ncbi:MAG: hypothetical protein DRI57_26505 [Deltaproteobacteria bacterium]|nr:MAG: hypothetical protein DRI57_26505 [Deltaproteobacteria bacterium]
MIKIRDIMTKDPITVSSEAEIIHVAKLLLEKHINGVPVVDETGEIVGIVCQSDLIAQQKELPIPSFFTFLDGFIPLTSMKQFEQEVQRVAATKVSDIMTPDPVTVSPDTPLETVATLMVERNFHTIPVEYEERLVGIVGKEDVLRTLMPNLD